MNRVGQPQMPEIVERRIGARVLQVQQTFLINSQLGLHAWPCSLLVKTLQASRSKVMIEANGERASGDGILGLMALAAGPGSAVRITVTGKDAHQTMTAIRRLFDARFGESHVQAFSEIQRLDAMTVKTQRQLASAQLRLNQSRAS